MGFSLYRVAALSPQGEHTLLPAYEDSGIVLGNLRDAADWRQAAGLLDQWVEQQSISPEKHLTTAADGKAALEGLPTGLYLLCAAPYQKGGCTYTTTPVLLELPAQQAGGGWQYAATVEPKLERSGTPEPPVIIIPDNPAPTPGDKLPQTGLLQWPITLLAAIGVLLVAVGCRLRRRKETDMTRERIGRFCIILGGLCILAAAFLLGFNLREERRAAAATQRILPAVAHSIGQSPAPMPTLPAGELTVSLEGEEYLGILSLPTLALELPVGAEWEMDFLRQAPCRYAGTLAGDDIIIAAHNYRRHFAALHTLRPGDAVLFTDAAGQTYRYTVDRVETLPETAVEEMRAGEWDLTLFTCTYDGRARVTVRCIRTEE